MRYLKFILCLCFVYSVSAQYKVLLVDEALTEVAIGGSGGTITGLTVSEGSPLGVVTNAGVLALTIPAGGGGSAAGNYSTAEMMTAGVTNEVAASETGNAHYFLELSQPSWVTFTGFTTNMSAVVMLEVKGTNSLTVTSDGGSVDWTGNVWLREGTVVPIMFTKPMMATNWIGSETL